TGHSTTCGMTSGACGRAAGTLTEHLTVSPLTFPVDDHGVICRHIRRTPDPPPFRVRDPCRTNERILQTWRCLDSENTSVVRAARSSESAHEAWEQSDVRARGAPVATSRRLRYE